MKDVTRYPLQWPLQRPRKVSRKNGLFGKRSDEGDMIPLTLHGALVRLQDEIDFLKVDDYVLSTDVPTRLDGLPRSGMGEPKDPGAALYFIMDGKPHCLPCDTYNKVADNVAAIAAHMNASRAIARYGVASVAEMYTGFLALPAPGAHRPWRAVLGFATFDHVSVAIIEERFKKLAKKHHPDNKETGSTEKMAELNLAKADALMEIGG